MVGAALEGDNLPVLITAMDIRRYVRRLIEIDLPEIPVLSHQENHIGDHFAAAGSRDDLRAF